MAISVRVGGSARAIAAMTLRIAGQSRAVRTVKLMDGGVLRTVYSSASPISLSVSPVIAAYSVASPVVSQPVSVTPAGGTGPYAYAWSLVSSTHPVTPPVVDAPTFASTRFSQANVPIGDDFEAVFRCTCTDSLGNSATADVNVVFRRIGGFPIL